eukprot:9405621-Pyramimonas_sp.AAC.1
MNITSCKSTFTENSGKKNLPRARQSQPFLAGVLGSPARGPRTKDPSAEISATGQPARAGVEGAEGTNSCHQKKRAAPDGKLNGSHSSTCSLKNLICHADSGLARSSFATQPRANNGCSSPASNA